MTINEEEIESWDSKYRLKFINSISGYKGVHLIGTKSNSGISNLAIFNSIVHISSEPARIGFIMRPLTVQRDTYNNIIESKKFTINHVHRSFLEQAHYTSAKFSEGDSEFEKCNLTEEYTQEFEAPFVGESNIKIGLKLIEDLEIKANGSRLIIGEVNHIHIEEKFIDADGQVDLEKAHDVCVTGLNQYSSPKKVKQIPYARIEDLPDFKKRKRPDNVAFNKDSQTYNASLLPYGSNIGAPSISTNNLSMWKKQSVSTYNHSFNNKIENIKAEYIRLTEEHELNKILYNTEYSFEPLIGAVYHLYEKENTDKHFLSLIPPNKWDKVHLGSFSLNSEKVWIQTTKENA